MPMANLEGVVPRSAVTAVLLFGAVEAVGAGLSGKAAIDEILAQEAVSDDHVDIRRCIPANRIRGVIVLSETKLLFAGRSEHWLMQLAARCPGLAPGSRISFERRSPNRLCAFDSVRIHEGRSLRRLYPGARCNLAKFESVTVEQVAALVDHRQSQRAATQ